jgi:hypothetical protein
MRPVPAAQLGDLIGGRGRSRSADTRVAEARPSETISDPRSVWPPQDPAAAPPPCGAARSPACRALYPPSLFERARVDRVEAELVQQVRDRLLGRRVIAGDHQSATILRARWLSVRGELGRVDVIEGLHDL